MYQAAYLWNTVTRKGSMLYYHEVEVDPGWENIRPIMEKVIFENTKERP